MTVAVTSTTFSCPICAGAKAKPVGDYNALHVARCLACGHGCVWPPPDRESLARLYAADNYYCGSEAGIGFHDYRAERRARSRMFGKHLDRIERAGARPGQLLDVGCATGDFLLVAAARRWHGYGVDPSTARSDAEVAGVRLVGRTVHDAAIPEHSLDLVTFWDVLEHVPDPRVQLRRAHELLRPGGMIALSVPDSRNLVARLSGRRWFGYRTAGEHLQFFTPDSLTAALRGAGFKLRVHQATTWSCSLDFLARRGSLYLGPPGRALGWLGGRSGLGRLIVDVPQINQFAIAVAAP